MLNGKPQTASLPLFGELFSHFSRSDGTMVELRGFEPLASSLRTRRSPN
jgi:hypothetical protein